MGKLIFAACFIIGLLLLALTILAEHGFVVTAVCP